MYFTGYLGSTEANLILADPGFALRIMPQRVMQHLGIPASQLSSTDTMFYGFNVNGACPLGKIELKCLIGDLKFEVTCYVIDKDTSYKLLLGILWIHHNYVISSTLHQVMKHINQDGEV